MNDLYTVPFYRVLINSASILKDPLPFHKSNFDKYGDTFGLMLNPKDRILFTKDAELIKHVLQKDHRNWQKSYLQTHNLAKYLGKGLLTNNGEDWLTQRRLIQPAFHRKRIQNLLDTMQSSINESIARLVPGDQDIYEFTSHLAFEVVGRTLFSSTDLDEKIAKLRQITEEAQMMVIKEMRRPYLSWYYNASGAIKKHIALAQEGRGLLQELIQERIDSKEPQDDLLQLLIESEYEDGTRMDMERLIDETMILFVAGHETTSNALTFTLQLLAKHPEVQDRARNEAIRLMHPASAEQMDVVSPVGCPMHNGAGGTETLSRKRETSLSSQSAAVEASNVGSSTVKPDTHDNTKCPVGKLKSDPLTLIKESKYIQACLEESMRLYPPAYFMDRVSLEEMEFNGRTYPAGTLLLMSIVELHRDPNHWQDPLKFDPDRFTAGEKHEAYFPFGAGPRKCIGNNFAMYEMQLAVAGLLSKFQVKPGKDIQHQSLITFKPAHGSVKLEPLID